MNSQTAIGHDGSVKRLLSLRDLSRTQAQLRRAHLHSVCEEARCPNRSECFARGVATFLIAGAVCTRGCRFCSIATGRPAPLDPQEPERLADAAAALGLRHVVVTMVNRDDLPDGAAAHLAATIRALRGRLPGVAVEVLTSDFRGNLDAVDTVCREAPEVFNHNVETVPRLYRQVRPGAEYARSLAVLERAALRLPQALIKSGLMLGHGESDAELAAVFHDLVAVGCNAVTIGQYFQPTTGQLPVAAYEPDERFVRVGDLARAAGIKYVWSGRFVRSSYMADRFLTVSSPSSTMVQQHG